MVGGDGGGSCGWGWLTVDEGEWMSGWEGRVELKVN